SRRQSFNGPVARRAAKRALRLCLLLLRPRFEPRCSPRSSYSFLAGVMIFMLRAPEKFKVARNLLACGGTSMRHRREPGDESRSHGDVGQIPLLLQPLAPVGGALLREQHVE